jgi:hypothetical protein
MKTKFLGSRWFPVYVATCLVPWMAPIALVATGSVLAARDDMPAAVVTVATDPIAGQALELSAEKSSNVDAFDWIIGNSDAGIRRLTPNASRVSVMLPEPGSYTVWLFAAGRGVQGTRLVHVRYPLTVKPAPDPRPDPAPRPAPDPAPPGPAPKPPEPAPVSAVDWGKLARDAAAGMPDPERRLVGICYRAAAIVVKAFPDRDAFMEQISDAMADQLKDRYIAWMPFKVAMLKAFNAEVAAGRMTDADVVRMCVQVADALAGKDPIPVPPPNPAPGPAPAPADVIPQATPLFVVAVSDLDAPASTRAKVAAVIFSGTVRQAAEKYNCKFINMNLEQVRAYPGIAAAGAALKSTNYYVVMQSVRDGVGAIVRQGEIPASPDAMVKVLAGIRGQ